MGKFAFVGPAYEAANPLQDNQALINWYLETDRNPEAKSPVALLGVPGLIDTGASALSGEVRGAHVLPGGNLSIWVIGNTVVLMSIAVLATATSKATFALTTLGTMDSSAGQVSIRDNGVASIVVIVDGVAMYSYNVKTGVFTKSADPAIINPDHVASVDGWLIFNKGGTQLFYTSPNYWNGLAAFDATFFALKDDAPDNLVTLIENNRQLWLVGEKTTEIWYNAGGVNFPFSRLQGATLQVGGGAKNSIARTGKGLVWLAYSERGGTSVIETEGYDYHAISSPALSYALTQYNVISDAFGYVYSEEGHEFYVLVFPTADVTWVYDFTTEIWHQRQSTDALGAKHRQRANCIANFGNQRLVGDYQNGKIYQQTRKAYSDGAFPLIALRRTPHVWDSQDRARVSHYWLQVEFSPGVGLATGQGSDPQIMVRWKDENGWSNERQVPIGKIGEARNRAILRRLSSSRDRVYEVSISDPVPRDVVGASLKAAGTLA